MEPTTEMKIGNNETATPATTTNTDTISKCRVCSKPAGKHCSGCLDVHYCSVEHQRSDWKVHKKTCSPTMMVDGHMVATRDLKKGFRVSSEPSWMVRPVIAALDDLCLGCYTQAENSRCKTCKWPLCSICCEDNEAMTHKENECTIFAHNGITMKKMEYKMEEIMALVPLLRGITLKKKKSVWKNFEKLYSSTNNDKKTETIKYISALSSQLGHVWSKLITYKEFDDIIKVATVLDVYGNLQQFQLLTGKPNMETKFVKHLHFKIRDFTISCYSNCCFAVGSTGEFEMDIHTNVPIKKGEVLTVPQRPNVVFYYPPLDCKCVKCSDPTGTHMGSMICAVKCTKCTQNGYLLKKPSNSFYECNKGCGEKKTIDEMRKLAGYLQKEIRGFTPNKVDEIEKKLDQLRKIVHPNHFLIMEACSIVTNEFVHLINSKTIRDDQLKLNIKLLMYLLQMAEFTAPGMSHTRGFLLMRLYNAKELSVYQLKDKIDAEQNEKLKKDLFKILQTDGREALKIMNEAMEIRKMSPEYRATNGKMNMKYECLFKQKLDLVAMIENPYAINVDYDKFTYKCVYLPLP